VRKDPPERPQKEPLGTSKTPAQGPSRNAAQFCNTRRPRQGSSSPAGPCFRATGGGGVQCVFGWDNFDEFDIREGGGHEASDRVVEAVLRYDDLVALAQVAAEGGGVRGGLRSHTIRRSEEFAQGNPPYSRPL
jgi:hypothetical protein